MAHAPRQAKKQVGFPKRGEIYLVAFDPTVGHEIQKTRPALIIQNDVSNRYSPLTIVAAITSQFSTPPHPREVVLEPGASGLSKPSAVVLNQIRTIDRLRLIKRLGAVDEATMKKVDGAIQISLGLIEL
ncbi:MAG: type II toxin-antitoxin system PemK/MazF family toxin [Bryobacteraceae bacterium]|nr:type II toxin-antitoxin system PemK/MazF family toxin [Bryobacteraceae bacterium]